MDKNEFCILLVDNDRDILEMIGYNLTSQGYKIITAENGLQAVELANVHLPHLILMDVMMPEMDGMEACELAKAGYFQMVLLCLASSCR